MTRRQTSETTAAPDVLAELTGETKQGDDNRPATTVVANTTVAASSVQTQSVARVTPQVEVKPRVTLAAYLQIRTEKADQVAGFRRFVEASKVKRQTVADWNALWDKFWTTPR